MVYSAREQWAMRRGSRELANVVHDIIQFEMGRPLFRNAFAGRWTVGNVSQSFRFHARAL